MKSIYIPNESFHNENEVNIINKLLSKLSESALDDIDDKIELWLIGNKDKDFFSSQVDIPMREHRVIDPMDELPIPEYREVQHVAIVNYKLSVEANLIKEFFYGNTDYDVTDFVTSVVARLRNKFPKTKAGFIKNNLKENMTKKIIV